MRNFLKKTRIIVWLPALLVIFIPGCKKNDINASGMLTYFLDCGSVDNPSRDCVDYHFDDQNVLLIKHRNAAFNCCHGDIRADMDFYGRTIHIKEAEEFSMCDCACLVREVNYEITGLEPGRYTIIVEGLYLTGGEKALEFGVNIYPGKSGTYCVERECYPWPH